MAGFRPLSGEEQETHIYWNAKERLWHAWTEYPPHARWLRRRGYEPQADGEWRLRGISIKTREPKTTGFPLRPPPVP